MDVLRPRNWWDRNWKWLVPTGCLAFLMLAIGFVAAIILFASTVMKSSDAYRLAVEKAQSSSKVSRVLGDPVRSGLFVSGNVHINGESGEADLSFPIYGPKGNATVHAKATKSMGTWTFSELAVRIDGTNETIDLQGTAAE